MDNPTVDREKLELRIVVTYNLLAKEFALDGCDANPVAALGVLDYALSRIRRFLTTNDVIQEAQEKSRIVRAGGPLA